MERALHLVALYKAVAQLGMAVGADVVDGIHALFELEERNVVALGADRNASALK
jgi:hypothetical protein